MQDEISQEESEQNAVDEMKKGADSNVCRISFCLLSKTECFINFNC